MSNRFISALKHLGSLFKQGIVPTLRIAETAGEIAVKIFAPELGPLFNSTVAAVVTAEQNFAALGKQEGTGSEKLASVVKFCGPLIAQALADMGHESDQPAVERYITGVVTVLNAVPILDRRADVPATVAATTESVVATDAPSIHSVAGSPTGAAISEILHG